ncbi:MAG TPA: cytochrome c maturation protein CcmE [Deinococcales bacterium]|nr:cytochrome c maturation protein CcmE [Deinococcales bacterium]
MNPPAAVPAGARARRRPLPWKYLLGLAVILGAIVYIVTSGLSQNLVFFLTPSEYLKDQAKYAGRVVRLGGIVQNGSVKWDKTNVTLAFRISDGLDSVPVVYKGAVPDLFREGSGVTVEGKFNGGTFAGSTLLIKHSEEYKAPTPGNDDMMRRAVQDAR